MMEDLKIFFMMSMKMNLKKGLEKLGFFMNTDSSTTW